ncbi:MAG: hypothetical protein ACYSTI_13330 [Planctomycetota bacterium]|jgi:hypothetical protein
MSDSVVAALNQIAEILKKEPGFLQTTAGQFAILILGAVLGGIFTYMVRKRLWQEDLERREQEGLKQLKEKRKLLVSLLGDEIALRWNQLIARDLRVLFEEFSEDNIGELCRMRFQPKDLYMFQRCAEDISLTTALEDRAVVSHVVYVHILARDFCDRQDTLRDCYKEYETAKARNVTGPEGEKGSTSYELRSNLKSMWKDLKGKFQDIDSQMVKIYARIEKEYNEYIESSAFIQEQERSALDVTARMRAVVNKRLPGASTDTMP